MKKKYNYLVLFFLLIIFILIFKYNSYVKMSIISSCSLWLTNLVPFMFPMYIITDLIINYGFGEFLYKIFKRNYPFLIFISMLLGTPSNAKYISEFYNSGYISLDEANYLLLFSYSPNPLFILGIALTTSHALLILLYIYTTGFLIAVVSKRFFKFGASIPKTFSQNSFSLVLESSIRKSFNILILILGIICIYGVLNTFLDIIFPNAGIFIKSILEMTNALKIIKESSSNVLLFMIFAVSFGGLSIHTQIKSILEDTPISYKFFLFGRLIASIPILIVILFN